MRPRWTNLSEKDRGTFRSTIAFLDGRLEERATVDWALGLKSNDIVKRVAVLDLLDSPRGMKLREPWGSAWRLIEECWEHPDIERDIATGAYFIQERLRLGDRSGVLVSAIVDLVAPRLKIESFSRLDLRFRRPPKHPKSFKDLFSIKLTSGEFVDPAVLEFDNLTDPLFVFSLASALDAAVTRGLDIARRIGWDGEHRLWQLGELYRVYYVPVDERADGSHEPDEFHSGITPSVKLLHAAVSRLVEIDTPAAIGLVQRWKVAGSPIHLRLWAALSRDSRVTPAAEVGVLLLSLDNRRFWDLHEFPEIAELRAKRFAELDDAAQSAITARIRKRPPRNLWSKKADANQIENARLYWVAREFKRVEIAGAALPRRDKGWLDSKIGQFPELQKMVRIDEGFKSSTEAYSVPPNPDHRFDLLAGAERLQALESALSSTRGGWDDNPAERAADWIREQGNPMRVAADFESVDDGGAAFSRVWVRFGWSHSPEPNQGEEAAQRDLPAEASRVLALLNGLPEETMRNAIDGISSWLGSWKSQIVNIPEAPTVWHRLWPVAVEATNAEQPVNEEIDLNTVVRSSDDREPMDLDTLNSPAGKLVGVFLAALPNLQDNDRPFDARSDLRTMRDAVTAASGRSGLIARHRMIEVLPYFLRADQDWTNEHLTTPLIADGLAAVTLWRAIARQTHFTEVLKIIGGNMAERAIDPRLDRKTRRSLVFNLVIECLHAQLEGREPAVPYPRVQQMIRSLDDEVRAYGANAIQRFVLGVSAPSEEIPNPPSPEALFRSAATPFLQQVWPQERSLATPGVSRALADLPATSRGAFAEAVDVIERFLVPFECWSMIDYGLYGEENGEAKLSNIDDQDKAEALLRLFDLTVGTAEGAVIPHNLADALDQVREVAPHLTKTRVYRRLATSARRS